MHEFSIQPPTRPLSDEDRRAAEERVDTVLAWYDALGPTDRLAPTKRWTTIRSSALVREMLSQALSRLAADDILRYFLTCIVTEFTGDKPDDVEFGRVRQHLGDLDEWRFEQQFRVAARVDDFAMHVIHHFLAPS
jgi:hypothetical protein